MNRLFSKNTIQFRIGMTVLLTFQVILLILFGMQKQGFHYDEYYSYYSTNVTHALVPTDMEWMDTSYITSEFMFQEGDHLGFGMVRLMQSLDVHPPLYYYVLHVMCALFPGVFSKWQGISVNIIFFILSWLTLASLALKVTDYDKKKVTAVCALFGFSPAVFSGVMFVRMYMMLTFVCLLVLWVHVNAIIKEQRTRRGFYIPVCLLSLVGFHIHYYFAVFLFFLAAATSLYLFYKKDTRKESFLYAGSVLTGMAVSVILYPSCLKHIFRGYRGTEAQDAFFDLSNIDDRILFFFDLTNEYTFGGMLVVLLLVLLLLGVTKKAKKNLNLLKKESEEILGQEEESTDERRNESCKKALSLIIIVTLCYFMVVAKTALLNAEEAIRYEMPIYGLLILIVVVGIGDGLAFFFTERNRKVPAVIFAGLIMLTLIGEIKGLIQGKVCFLYPQDRENVEWAEDHKDEAVVHIYNKQNTWMIWDESEELMQYEQIYFISGDHEFVDADDRLSAENTVYVYKMRGDAAEAVMNRLMEANGGFARVEKIRELLYCDLYQLTR